ncbi:MAG TPA: DUF1905 domain-containing protein [Blastococcus sp.]|nr:DUF1905 domain-containing protein [Blastococcus sp.]
MEPVEFTSTPVTTDRGHVRLPLPFDPRERWGRRARHYVEGTVGGAAFAGSVGFAGGGAFLVLNARFREEAGISPGEEVRVSLTPVDR